jgi:hypothetical protein
LRRRALGRRERANITGVTAPVRRGILIVDAASSLPAGAAGGADVRFAARLVAEHGLGVDGR